MPLPNEWWFQALGTDWTIQTGTVLTEHTKHSIMQLIEIFNINYSRFQSDSIVKMIYDSPGAHSFTERSFPQLYAFYVELYSLTKGSVTPLVGEILADAGYNETYQLRSFDDLSAVADFRQIKWDGKYKVKTDTRMLLDFGAAAKGLLVDRIADELRNARISEWYIDASGDSIHHAASSYTIGFEHPFDTTRVIGTIELQNQSLCASATNRRAWANGHHVIDGKSGKPTSGIVATWVIADSTMIADGLATALFFEWNAIVEAYPNACYLRMESGGMIEMNQAMKDRITLFS